MSRPLPIMPRGPRRRGCVNGVRPVLLACPRVSPEWELGTLRVLMKPHDWTRGAVEHQRPAQPWPPGSMAVVEAACDAVGARLGFRPAVHFPEAGDFFFVIELHEAQLEPARAMALLLSRRLRGAWLTLDRLFIRDGRFYRRQRGFMLNLVTASNVHLSRATRARLKGVL